MCIGDNTRSIRLANCATVRRPNSSLQMSWWFWSSMIGDLGLDFNNPNQINKILRFYL